MTIDQFLKQYENKSWDFDGAYGAQCFDLFQFYKPKPMKIITTEIANIREKAPTSTYPTANTLAVTAATGAAVALTVIADDILTDYSARVACTTASGLTAGNATNLVKNNSTSTILFSAEL